MGSEEAEICLIKYSAASLNDLGDIWAYTAETWGVAQADDYQALLLDEAQSLALNPLRGSTIDSKARRRLLIKWPGSAYGHNLIYSLGTPGEVHVLRFLHSSRRKPVAGALTALEADLRRTGPDAS